MLQLLVPLRRLAPPTISNRLRSIREAYCYGSVFSQLVHTSPVWKRFQSNQHRSTPIGVQAALVASKDSSYEPRSTIFDEFALNGRVAVVTGGKQGLGLEMAMALAEAGASAYCLDLQPKPSEDFFATQKYLAALGRQLSYVSVDVTNQKEVWNAFEAIGSSEGRLDVCIAAAGILHGADCLNYEDTDFQKVMNVNTNGVLHTAQAAGQQMTRFGLPGSIILIASMSGSLTNRNEHGKAHNWVAYNTSKSAVVQMARSLACELGPEKIRVNSLSPGHITTAMTSAYLDKVPGLEEAWSKLNPLGRLGRSDELRGVVTWLASDASTFCTGSDILVTGKPFNGTHTLNELKPYFFHVIRRSSCLVNC